MSRGSGMDIDEQITRAKLLGFIPTEVPVVGKTFTCQGWLWQPKVCTWYKVKIAGITYSREGTHEIPWDQIDNAFLQLALEAWEATSDQEHAGTVFRGLKVPYDRWPS